MKSFEVKALGLEDLSVNESRDTNGGSVTLLICAAATLFLAAGGCTRIVVKGDNNEVNVGDDKQQSGGTNVETDVEVAVV